MSVNVEFPDVLLLAFREEPDALSRRVRIYTLGHLYAEGKISAGLGAQVLNCPREEFYLLLSEHGFKVIGYPAGELAQEAASSAEIARRARQE